MEKGKKKGNSQFQMFQSGFSYFPFLHLINVGEQPVEKIILFHGQLHLINILPYLGLCIGEKEVGQAVYVLERKKSKSG